MSCLKKKTPEDRALQYLLGKTKFSDRREEILYHHAMLCMPFGAISLNGIMSGSSDEDPLFQIEGPLPPTVKQQTYNMWKASMDLGWNLGYIKRRKTIYIQPLDEFPDFMDQCIFNGQTITFFKFLQNFASIFFMGFDVKLCSELNTHISGWNVTSRYHKLTEEKQLLVTDLQKELKRVLPRDGCCILGITWTDLYPTEDLNFVLGEANSSLSAAVFCFGRFEPKSYKEGKVPFPIEEIDGALIWKMIKVLTHETCHVFGLAHCVYFRCAMNESTSLRQALDQPLFLCPVCLNKLQKVCKFDLHKRYFELKTFLEAVQVEYPCYHIGAAISWLDQCLKTLDLSGGKNGGASACSDIM